MSLINLLRQTFWKEFSFIYTLLSNLGIRTMCARRAHEKMQWICFLPTNEVIKTRNTTWCVTPPSVKEHDAHLFDGDRLLLFSSDGRLMFCWWWWMQFICVTVCSSLAAKESALLLGSTLFFGATVSSSPLFCRTSFPSNLFSSSLLGYEDGGQLRQRRSWWRRKEKGKLMCSSSFNPTSSPSNSCTSSPRSTQLGRNRIILEQDSRLDFFVPAPPVKQIITGGRSGKLQAVSVVR